MGTVESNVEHAMSGLESQLRLWGAKLDELFAKAKVSKQEAQIESRKHLDELKLKLDAATTKLQAAKAAGGDKWDAFKHDLESSWKDLEGAFKKLVH